MCRAINSSVLIMMLWIFMFLYWTAEITAKPRYPRQTRQPQRPQPNPYGIDISQLWGPTPTKSPRANRGQPQPRPQNNQNWGAPVSENFDEDSPPPSWNFGSSKEDQRWGSAITFPTFAPDASNTTTVSMATTGPPINQGARTLSPLIENVHYGPPNCDCPRTGQFNPVCGTDGRSYNNPSLLKCYMNCGYNVDLQHNGACRRKVGVSTRNL